MTHLIPKAILRITRECQTIDTHPEQMMSVVYDLNDLSFIHVMIIGPSDSPYHGGFFYFKVEFPAKYFFVPPHLTFLTPEHKLGCRLHPNLYQDGKVCLSMLNTWQPNEWSPALTLEKIFLTIQTLLDNNPIRHEPSLESEQPNSPDAVNYRIVSLYRTLETAVIGMLNRTDIPDKFKTKMRAYFLSHYDDYITQIDKLRPFNGQTVESFHKGETIDCAYISRIFKETRDLLSPHLSVL
jgi:ubiquitin-protein ligase